MKEETKELLKIGYLINFLSNLGIFHRLSHKTETGSLHWSVIWKPFKVGNNFIEIEGTDPLSIILKRIFDKYNEDVNKDWQHFTDERELIKSYYDTELLKVEQILKDAEAIEKEITCLK